MQKTALTHTADQEEHRETQRGHRPGHHEELVPGVEVAQERRHCPLVTPSSPGVLVLVSSSSSGNLGSAHLLLKQTITWR